MIGQTLGGRYHIIRHLGEGAFSQTYLAEDTQLPHKDLCVVKHLKPHLTDEFTLRAARHLFEKEAKVLSHLGKHDQIPRLLAHFEENKEFYLIEEFIEGEELTQELTPGKQLSEAEVIDLLHEILEVLVFVHQQNIIHRDIKPSNLIRRKQDGKIVLIDFGAVKQISTQVVGIHEVQAKSSVNPQAPTSLVNPQAPTSFTVAVVGTPDYMPGEQFQGKPRLSSDIYAVGIVGIQALTGLFPHQIPEIIWRSEEAVPKEVHLRNSPELAKVLAAMIHHDFSKRYLSAKEALEAIEALKHRTNPPERQVALTSVLVSALLVALGLVGGGVWLLTNRPSSEPSSFPVTDLKTSSASEIASEIASEVASNIATSIPSHTRNYISDFSSVENVPSGEFAYGSSAAWASTHRDLNSVLQATRPEFQLRYTPPTNGIPSSSASIRMLLDNQVAFAHSSRPLHSDEYQKALQKGYSLSEITVALEGIVIVVHPDLNIPGLTLAQLKDIYTGKITNWNQVGGPNLAITPYSLSAKESGIAEFFDHFVMQDLPFAENVTFVPTTTSAVGQVAENLGGIYYAPAPDVIGQCTIKPLPIGNHSDKLIPPYQEPLVPPSDCPGRRNQLNMTAMQTGQYPILQPLFVAVKHDSQVNEQAGGAYANLLLTDQGQELIRQAGFIAIRCLSHYVDTLATCGANASNH